MIEKDPMRRLKKNIESLNIHSDEKNAHIVKTRMTEPTDIIRNSPAELAIQEMHPGLRMDESATHRGFSFSSDIAKNAATKNTTDEHSKKDLHLEDPQEFLIKRCRGLEGALEEIRRLPKNH